MTNYNQSQISSMNCQELAFMISEFQKELEVKNTKIAELKNSVFESLHKITEFSGNTDIAAEIIKQFQVGMCEDNIAEPENISIGDIPEQGNKELPIEKNVEQISKIEPSFQTQQEVLNEKDSEKDIIFNEKQLPSLDDLANIDDQIIMDSLVNDSTFAIESEDVPNDESSDPTEYKNEGEYELIKKRGKMLQPLDILLSGAITPNIGMLGSIMSKDKSFIQNYRIISAESGGGNTLTTVSQPWVYIPNKEVA